MEVEVEGFKKVCCFRAPHSPERALLRKRRRVSVGKPSGKTRLTTVERSLVGPCECATAMCESFKAGARTTETYAPNAH